MALGGMWSIDGYESDWELEQQLLADNGDVVRIVLHKVDKRGFWRQVKAFGLQGHVLLADELVDAQLILVDRKVAGAVEEAKRKAVAWGLPLYVIDGMSKRQLRELFKNMDFAGQGRRG